MTATHKPFISLLLAAAAITCVPSLCFADDLTGTWKLQYIEANGRKFPASSQTVPILVIAGNSWTESSKQQNTGFRADYSTDNSKSPKQLNLKILTGKGSTAKGIYSIEGNVLKICRTSSGSRPKE